MRDAGRQLIADPPELCCCVYADYVCALDALPTRTADRWSGLGNYTTNKCCMHEKSTNPNHIAQFDEFARRNPLWNASPDSDADYEAVKVIGVDLELQFGEIDFETILGGWAPAILC